MTETTTFEPPSRVKDIGMHFEGLALLAETITGTRDSGETRYLLSAAAALKGHSKLGDILEGFD